MTFTPIEVIAMLIVCWVAASIIGYFMGVADRRDRSKLWVRTEQDDIDDELRTWSTRL